MVEVLVAGGGPAGAVAALMLARAGVRVLVADRATFPRDKLCGDTINPGSLALLSSLGVDVRAAAGAMKLDGMTVTSERGLRIEGRYSRGLFGVSLARRTLDQRLLDAAIAAGAHVEQGVRVVAPLVEEQDGRSTVRGATLDAGGREMRVPALVTIAADGRRSSLAVPLGLAAHPPRPRRWAIGAYFAGVQDLEPRGEMHIRPAHYLGIAPLAGGVANVCVVTAVRTGFADPEFVLLQSIERDPLLRDRFASAERAGPVVTLGPLAVDAPTAGAPGLLLAGDAAGFIDPMTGDGLRFAIEGGWLAARAALEVLEDPTIPGYVRLTERRRRAFGAKLRLNRTLRRLVATGRGVRAGGAMATLAPAVVRQLVTLAGDVPLARRLAASGPTP